MANNHDAAAGSHPADPAWAPCPVGELAHLAARRDAHRRLQQAKRIIVGSVAAMTAAAAVLLAVGSFRAQPFHCEQCQAQFAAYHAHQTGGPQIGDPALVQQIAAHLAHCPDCRRKYAAAYPDVTARRNAADRQETAFARRVRRSDTTAPHARWKTQPAPARRADHRLA